MDFPSGKVTVKAKFENSRFAFSLRILFRLNQKQE